jgi:heme exporter protein C
MCAIALVSGAVWGKPTWGTYWFWDARLTSMLILFFLYVGVIALGSAIASPVLAARATSVLAIVGAVNIPIIKYSVDWWNTLHQPATFKLTERPAMAPEMYQPFFVCLAGFYLFFALVVVLRLRNAVLEREASARWVKQLGTETG